MRGGFDEVGINPRFTKAAILSPTCRFDRGIAAPAQTTGLPGGKTAIDKLIAAGNE